jgi:hypothetical protein
MVAASVDSRIGGWAEGLLLGALGVRFVKEVALALLALAAALIVIAPVLAFVRWVYAEAGIYWLLVIVTVAGVSLLLYQARIRSWLFYRRAAERRRAGVWDAKPRDRTAAERES